MRRELSSCKSGGSQCSCNAALVRTCERDLARVCACAVVFATGSVGAIVRDDGVDQYLGGARHQKKQPRVRAQKPRVIRVGVP